MAKRTGDLDSRRGDAASLMHPLAVVDDMLIAECGYPGAPLWSLGGRALLASTGAYPTSVSPIRLRQINVKWRWLTD